MAGSRIKACSRPRPCARATLVAAALLSCMATSLIVERATPRRKSDDGEQEVGGLRRIGRNRHGLGAALARDEAGVTTLPSVELPIEEDPPRRVVRQRREMSVHAGDETRGTVCGAASERGVSVLAVRLQCLLRSVLQAGANDYSM